MQSIPGTPPSLVFTIPVSLAVQTVGFQTDVGQYRPMYQKLRFDPSLATLVIDPDTASILLDSKPNGTCLNNPAI